MEHPTDEQIQAALVGIISDGFNRSLDALKDEGAMDTTELDKHYRGAGSHYYEIVTEQIAITAKYGVRSIRMLLSQDGH